MVWSSRFFSIPEMRCKCGCNKADMDPAFMRKLDGLRERYGFALVVSSGFRCPKHNAHVSGTGATGPHTTGHAVDFAIDRGAALRVLTMAVMSGNFTGIGVDQHGPSRFLHLDDLPDAPGQPRPTIWSYP